MEHLQTIEFALEGLAPIDELLQRLPRRKTLSMGRPPPVVAGVGFPSPEHGPSTPAAARTGLRNSPVSEEGTVVRPLLTHRFIPLRCHLQLHHRTKSSRME